MLRQLIGSFGINLDDLCAYAVCIKRVGEFAQRGTIRKEKVRFGGLSTPGRRRDFYPVFRIYKDLSALFDR